MGQAEDRIALGLRVPMDDLRLDVGSVGQQAVEDVDALVHATGNEVAEQRHVFVRHVVVAICPGDPIVGAGHRVARQAARHSLR